MTDVQFIIELSMSYTNTNTSPLSMDCMKMVFKLMPNWKREAEVKKLGYKVHGHPFSTNTRRVLAVLLEKGLSYDPITVDLKAGEHKSESFLSLNPFGQIPVFEDGNVKLCESRAITQYIAYVHSSRGTQLLNLRSHETMATLTMWMEIEAHQFDPVASKLTWEQAIKPLYGLETDHTVVKQSEANLEKVLNIYEKRLGESKFLACNTFTLVDLHHLPNIQYLLGTPTKRLFENRPKVRKWVDEITSREAWKMACDQDKSWFGKQRKNLSPLIRFEVIANKKRSSIKLMAGIKVFGHPASTATRRVLIALHEKDLDFELVHVELKDGEHKKEPFLSRNPFGKVPAFEDGDFKLFESRAITQYIAHEYSDKGNQLLSLGPKNMAIMAMGMEIEAHEFDSVASKLCWEIIFKHIFGLTTDQAVVEAEEAKLAKVLDVYEARLGQSKYLSCDQFTLVDLHHIPVIQYLLGTPIKKHFDERPHVTAWVADITSRPSSQKILRRRKLNGCGYRSVAQPPFPPPRLEPFLESEETTAMATTRGRDPFRFSPELGFPPPCFRFPLFSIFVVFTSVSVLSDGCSHGGVVKDALVQFETALSLDPNPIESQAAYYNKACCHAYRGEGKKAADCLRVALRDYNLKFATILNDPDLASFRALPEFKELQEEARLGGEDIGDSFRRDLKLISEVRAPFRISTLFTVPRLIQAIRGGDGAPDLLETTGNAAINIGGIVVLVSLFLWENKKEEEQMVQITRDETLSRLPLRLSTNRVVELVQLRDTVRPVILAGKKESVTLAMQKADRFRTELLRRGVLLVPVVWGERKTPEIEKKKGFGASSKSATSLPSIGEDFDTRAQSVVAQSKLKGEIRFKSEIVSPGEWERWIRDQQIAEGVVPGEDVYIILRLDGRVRRSGKGMPDWAEISKELPPMDDVLSKLER
ncbi:unnamed protein product [Thlaspi arvense]|uniref:glutathione transferase n=1 Tax=Thlaspi arvense TaxID=13288 RepID=A0AAU9RG23_THLAR|nr:unnamed protein product [Thlaspi arvense]